MTTRLRLSRLVLAALLAAPLLGMAGTSGIAARKPTAPASMPAPQPAISSEGILAVVNGDVVTQGDVEARAKLFAMLNGITLSPDDMQRLAPQIVQQLIDERLRLQEAQSRQIAVPDADIAAQIDDMNKRDNGNLRNALAANGISLRTLVDQLRAQIAWTQVLRQEIGAKAQVTPAEVDQRMAVEKAASGQPEYEVAEIFVPIASASRADAAEKFANTVIDRLRKGAAFGNMAEEFSQSEDALSGGELGWVRPGELDNAVADVVTQMPVGAISNPIRVPGGFTIVTLEDKRTAGMQMVTMASVRRAFFPFTEALNPAAPTAQQKAALASAVALSKTAHDCAAVEAANLAAGNAQPADPGPLPLERISNPALKQILTNLTINKPSQPLVSQTGILVMMVCRKTPQNLAQVTREDMANRIVDERVERLSRTLERDLEREANITRYGIATLDDDQT